jgi:TolA-binding protein
MVNATPCVWNNVKECDHVTQYVAMKTIKRVVHYGKKMCIMGLHRMMMSQNMSESMREEMSEMMRNMREGMDKMEDGEMDKMEGEMDKMEGEMDKMEGEMEDDMEEMEKEDKERKELMEKMEKMFQSVDQVSEVRERVRAFMSEGGEMSENLEGIMKLLSMAPEDGMCVDPAKYREAGRCDPAMAMECMMSVDQELLSPMSTRDRLCL